MGIFQQLLLLNRRSRRPSATSNPIFKADAGPNMSKRAAHEYETLMRAIANASKTTTPKVHAMPTNAAKRQRSSKTATRSRIAPPAAKSNEPLKIPPTGPSTIRNASPTSASFPERDLDSTSVTSILSLGGATRRGRTMSCRCTDTKAGTKTGTKTGIQELRSMRLIDATPRVFLALALMVHLNFRHRRPTTRDENLRMIDNCRNQAIALIDGDFEHYQDFPSAFHSLRIYRFVNKRRVVAVNNRDAIIWRPRLCSFPMKVSVATNGVKLD